MLQPGHRTISAWRAGGIIFSLLLALVTGCATESHRALTPETVPASRTAYQGVKSVLVVGKFQNRSVYMRGIFSDGIDQLGSQAKTILKTHLQQSGRFEVLDRENMNEISQEAKLSGALQKLQGAQFVLTGDVTEFGRRTTGDSQLFGILGYGKKQLAYAKAALNLVDVKTSRIIYSVQGAGEYALDNHEIIGFGSTAGYDATLNGKVLNLAIMEAVNHLINGLERGEWKPSPVN